MKRPLIYLAGPYTKPDPCENTHRAIVTANKLIDLGFDVFIPHLSHFWHTVTPKPYTWWTEYDLRILQRCDIVYRMLGESPGADTEVAYAQELDILVVHEGEDIIDAIADKAWFAVKDTKEK
jgi:nucleoside 2-deoxyribosyltransferase